MELNQKALMARFDADHDGEIDAAEWETVRAAAFAEARQNNVDQAPEERVSVLANPRGDQPFLIAAQSTERPARIERRRALAGLALTLASLIVTCYAIAHIRSGKDVEVSQDAVSGR